MADDPRALGDPGSESFRVDSYPFYLLNRAVSRYNVIIEAQLRAIEIDIPTWRVLMVLGEESPRSIGQLSKTAVIHLSTMMRIIERMMKAGLVERAPDAQDGRVTNVILTDLGREKLAAARKLTAPLYRQVISGFSQNEFTRLLEMLNRLHANLG
ncbi:DNA-binding MarR family transcriptional regulator [Brevundimonas nasdae]|jgi:DNA-binding MarR family transcriptional regulator|uniref:MarR family winged helix-turn-helix transcriptional regulator n=1 Tax=Brevundimonas TaxID=41275 RepID=UPI0019120951|nr:MULTISPECIES: MarR family winged helix-turn-helix transcriptional regulator [Brevundimonas]MBK6026868.1 winged helix-turn-helix transcriptional regulator [Brevundimonas nasdae]MDQ0453549.1 DNA-binding MarR family transcriptional regulator [Brevundimonas nasdae]